MRRWIGSAGVGVTAVLTACSSATQGSSPTSRSSTELGAEEIAAASVSTAFDALQRLRPRWLRSRARGGAGERGQPVLYLNNIRQQSLDQLRLLRARDVEEMRYLSAGDASLQFGTNHPAGAILVRTKSG